MDSGGSFRFSGGNSAGTDAPAEFSGSSAGNGGDFRHISLASADPRVALFNLSLLRQKMDTLQQFLSESLHRDTLIGKDRMDMVSTEIVSAIQQVIVNGAALISCSQDQNLGSRVKECHPVMMTREVPVQPDVMMMPSTSSLVTGKVTNPGCSSAGKGSMSSLVTIKAAEPADPTAGTNHPFTEKTSISADSRGRRCNSRAPSAADIKIGMTSTLISDHPKNIGYLKVAAAADEEMKYEVDDGDCEIVELDAVELLEEHIHHCEICGKGFKRDANLRMHMRAHGNQFKTLEALAKPDRWAGSSLKTRFSCPFEGCNRNKSHKKFRPLKSVICVKNHFKRSHCPKLFSCNRCNKKSFSVVADLKSHLKHCGESKWRCSCGTSFSRKDKLFGHMALFEGHMPAVARENGESNGAVLVEDDVDLEEEEEEETQLEGVPAGNYSDDGFFDDLLKGFDAIDGGCLKDVLGSSDLGIGMDEFYKI